MRVSFDPNATVVHVEEDDDGRYAFSRDDEGNEEEAHCSDDDGGREADESRGYGMTRMMRQGRRSRSIGKRRSNRRGRRKRRRKRRTARLDRADSVETWSEYPMHEQDDPEGMDVTEGALSLPKLDRCATMALSKKVPVRRVRTNVRDSKFALSLNDEEIWREKLILALQREKRSEKARTKFLRSKYFERLCESEKRLFRKKLASERHTADRLITYLLRQQKEQLGLRQPLPLLGASTMKKMRENVPLVFHSKSENDILSKIHLEDSRSARSSSETDDEEEIMPSQEIPSDRYSEDDDTPRNHRVSQREKMKRKILQGQKTKGKRMKSDARRRRRKILSARRRAQAQLQALEHKQSEKLRLKRQQRQHKHSVYRQFTEFRYKLGKEWNWSSEFKQPWNVSLDRTQKRALRALVKESLGENFYTKK
eukprot:g2571.t1